jgi:hypothetical protein
MCLINMGIMVTIKRNVCFLIDILPPCASRTFFLLLVHCNIFQPFSCFLAAPVETQLIPQLANTLSYFHYYSDTHTHTHSQVIRSADLAALTGDILLHHSRYSTHIPVTVTKNSANLRRI